ncbi:tetratricopeptide repeat protein [Amycolatopsis acidicola]|uniref:Tetratricopeptide repeat protein n=1 Tax=Amycolatopsis acidicola TaxID=2596893 RepID=A0A5N0UK91_9PSEU|nr:tetratricopeptide repeat protein [Amycolatopsis acidicola]KAA9149138.1 tetratricopeptide repeat protein [Amycolatopsis acidicola]
MLTLTIGADEVVLRIGGEAVRHVPDGPDDLLRELAWRLSTRPSPDVAGELGIRLGRRFLAGAAGAALARELGKPGRAALAIEAEDELPWEAAILPGGEVPLALDERVDVSRAVPGGVPPRRAPGPLRILAAIASPDTGGGELLDYEHELARILDSVDPGGRRNTAVRVLEWGSTAAIRAALAEEPCEVLHISCHGRPGELLLETESGEPDHVGAARFLAEALPEGVRVPFVVLTGCATALSTPFDVGGLARGLVCEGTPAVLAMRGQVGDRYVISLCARLYEKLAGQVDLRSAVASARRELAGDGAEWIAPVLFLANGNPPPLAPADVSEPATEPHRPASVLAWHDRSPGYFVGRRAALRRLSREPEGVLLHGIGGVGKTSLAAELASRAERAGAVVVALTGRAPVDAILDATRSALSKHCAEHGFDAEHPARRAVSELSKPDVEWPEQLPFLRAAAVSVLLVLDNAEDNLDGSTVDEELAAFLAAWPGRVLITSRHPFAVPRLPAYHVGPLSWPETRKLMWRLPGLDALTAHQQRLAWHQLGGHPRALEYLDALLRAGRARFDDVTEAMSEAGAFVAEDVLLPELLATLEDQPLARKVLFGASVYRKPVDRNGLAWQVGEVHDVTPEEHTEIPPLTVQSGLDEAVAAVERLGLLAPADGGHLVHPATATALHRLAEPGFLADAHQRAAGYWMWHLRQRDADELVDITHLVEAAYHYYAGGDAHQAALIVLMTCDELQTRGRWSWAEQLCRQARAWLPPSGITAELTLRLSSVRFERGDTDGSEQLAQEALRQFENLGERTNEAAALHRLGMIAQHRGDHFRAKTLYERSRAIHEELGNHNSVGIAWHQLGVLAQDDGDIALAERNFERSLTASRAAGDLMGVASATHQLGMLAEKRGDLVKAETCYLAAQDAFGRLGDRGLAANAEVRLAEILRKQWRLDQAIERVLAALAVFEEIGSVERIAECRLRLGTLGRDRGDFAWAASSLAAAADLFGRIGSARQAAEAHALLGEARTLGGEYADAVVATLESLALREEMDMPIGNVHSWLGIQYAELGEPAFRAAVSRVSEPGDAEFVVDLARQHEELMRGNNLNGAAATYRGFGLDAARTGQLGAARAYFRASLAQYEAARNLLGVANTHEQLGNLAIELREFGEAEWHFLRAQEIHERLGDPVNVAIGYHQLGVLHQKQNSLDVAAGYFRASLELKRRLGNREGEVNSLFHAGLVEEMRGEFDEALRIYGECLDIDWALGNFGGIAITHAQIGIIHGRRGQHAEAVPWLLAALTVNLRLNARANVVKNISELRARRRDLGEREFAALVRQDGDEAAAREVLRLTELLPSAGGEDADA